MNKTVVLMNNNNTAYIDRLRSNNNSRPKSYKKLKQEKLQSVVCSKMHIFDFCITQRAN